LINFEQEVLEQEVLEAEVRLLLRREEMKRLSEGISLEFEELK